MDLTTKLQIYNGALQLIGERRLNLVDDQVEARYDLDNVWDLKPWHYCAEVIRPRFAVTTVELTATGGQVSLPDGFIALVGLFNDASLDQPITRFTREGTKLNVEEDVVYLRYVDESLSNNLLEWTPTFIRVVIAYVAMEIAEQMNSDKRELITSLFQQRVELAIQTSSVDEPALRPVQSAQDNLKLSLYNNALMMVGLPRLKSLLDDEERRYVLDDAWVFNPARYCAEIIKPRFAATTVSLKVSRVSIEHGLSQTFDLPLDFVELIGLFSDKELDQRINRFTREGNKITCDYSTVYIRYVSNLTLEDYTKWTQGFTRAVYASLAKSLADAMVPERIEAVSATAAQYIENSRSTDTDDDPIMRSKNSTFQMTEDWLHIYNDALLLLSEEQLTTLYDDSRRRSILDVAVRSNLVPAILEDIGWHWASTSMKITADPAIEPEWGYRYGHHLPTDMHRFDGVWYDEYFQTPIKYYTDEDGVLLCDVDEIYIQYVSNEWLHTPEKWKPSFKRFVAAKLAYDTMGVFSNADKNAIARVYEERMSDIKSIDVQQSPPHILTRGNWSRTRTMGGRNRGRP